MHILSVDFKATEIEVAVCSRDSPAFTYVVHFTVFFLFTLFHFPKPGEMYMFKVINFEEALWPFFMDRDQGWIPTTWKQFTFNHLVPWSS